jgi:hypothetical protein
MSPMSQIKAWLQWQREMYWSASGFATAPEAMVTAIRSSGLQ